ncbi:MAG: hypothetical protein LBL46_04305 [Rickettsiales bacterium]|jgi:hypothetical protein|nr:hypothetical protein [Rickettsiales bacterium]
MKPVITIDIDNVVFAHDGIISGAAMTLYGMFTGLLDSVIGALPPAFVNAIMNASMGSARPAHIQVPYCIARLAETTDPHFLSARPPYSVGAVANLFDRYGMKIPRDRLVFVPSDRKAETAIALGSILHIDDSDMVIKSMMKIGMNHCMISNDKTKYNHYLRPAAQWLESIVLLQANRTRFFGNEM